MAYVARPAPKMGLGESENPLSRLARIMAEYYYPGGSPADPRGSNVTDIPMPQQSMPRSDRMDFGPQPQPENPGWTTSTVQAVPYEPSMDMGGGGMPPMPAPSPERMPIPTRGMMPPQGVPPMPERDGGMAQMGGAPREAIAQALMGAEQRPPLPSSPQFGNPDWWNQIR